MPFFELRVFQRSKKIIMHIAVIGTVNNILERVKIIEQEQTKYTEETIVEKTAMKLKVRQTKIKMRVMTQE